MRGLGSVRRADFETLSGPEFTLRKPPRITVRGHPVQGAHPVAAKSSASIKDVPLEQQTPLWAPRISPRDRRESRRKGRQGESRGAGKPSCPCPFCPRRRAAAFSRHVMANNHRPGRVILASSGALLYRRNRFPSAEGKKRKTDGIVSRTAFAKPDRRSCSGYPRGRAGRSSGTGRCSSSCPARYREYAACSQPRSAGSRRETATYSVLRG